MSNDIFDSAFPFMQQVAKSQTPDARELANRTGIRSPSKPQPKPMGRPKKQGGEIHFHPENPELTNLVFKDEEQTKLAAGSVLQVLFPDGSTQTLVALSDTRLTQLTP